MAQCSFPACKIEAVKGIYCYDHNRLMGVRTDKKEQKPPSNNNDKKQTTKAVKIVEDVEVKKLLIKAQGVFNAFIRKRDKNKTCISCHKPVEQAGHYLSVAGNSALRFDENNVHGQCIECNCYKQGNLIEYRKGLVQRIGEEKVLAIENSQYTIHKWTQDQLNAIIKLYKR